MATVKLDGVEKFFGPVQVLHNVELKIDDGDFIVLVGPSGCGKSTLLRMIAGLEEVSAGQIRIDDEVVNDLPPKKRDLAMVFQSYALYPHMTVAENMGFSLRLANAPKQEIKREVARAGEILGLTNYLDRYPRHLSGGQRQRVAMGRAIVRDPKLFLFDEPLSNLDAKLRTQMRAEIKLLQHRLGTTTVYVTHDQTEAMTMADTIVVMRDGRIEQTGKPLELFNAPTNAFVAGFIGSPSMNFFEGRIHGNTVRFPDGSAMQLDDAPAIADGGSVQIGIRPKHFKIVKQADHALQLDVEVVEPTGDEVEIRGKILDQDVTAIFELDDMPDSDRLSVMPDSGRVFVFDAQTGKSLVKTSAKTIRARL